MLDRPSHTAGGTTLPQPLFSVVIPTYQRRERLLRALRSVLAQDFADYEVLVVDDGSTDGSAEAAGALGGRIRVLRQANRGPGAARNAGAREARGEYLVFLDSDDTWLPWTLGHYAAIVREHRPSWLYGRGFLDLDDALRAPPPQTARAARWHPTYLAAAAEDGVMPYPTGVALRRDLLLASGGFDEEMRVGEDVDLWFRLGQARGFVLMDAPLTCVRELHGESLSEDVVRSFRGLSTLIARERAGRYAGDTRAAFTRRAVVTRYLMFYAAQYRLRGHPALAARFYLDVLRFQASARFREPGFGGQRNRFLLSFPVFLASPGAYGRLKRRISGAPPR